METRKKLPIHIQVFIGLLLGAIVGICAQSFVSDKAALKSIADNYAKPIGNIFIYGIFMVVVPLLLLPSPWAWRRSGCKTRGADRDFGPLC